MRSRIEGWVEKRLRTPSVPEKGFTMKRLAVAGCSTLTQFENASAIDLPTPKRIVLRNRAVLKRMIA